MHRHQQIHHSIHRIYLKFNGKFIIIKLFKHFLLSYSSGDINSGVPITLLAYDFVFSVARPRSPILTDPFVPVIKILSHYILK